MKSEICDRCALVDQCSNYLTGCSALAKIESQQKRIDELEEEADKLYEYWKGCQKEYSKLKEQNRWRNVSEEIPTEHDKYQICFDDGDGYDYDYVWWRNDWGYFYGGEKDYELKDIKFWKPITPPEQPVEKVLIELENYLEDK